MSDSLWPRGLQHTHSIESVIPSNCLILCLPLLLLPSIFPSIRVFSNQLALWIRWLKPGSFSISPSNEYSGLISFRIHWFDLLVEQGILKSILRSRDITLLTKVCIVKASSEPGWWRPAWVARPIYVTCTEGAREQKPLGLNDIIRCSQWAAESQQRLGARLAHLCLLTTSSDKNPPVSAC